MQEITKPMNEQSQFEDLFDVEKEAKRRHGAALTDDIYPRLAELRRQTPVMRGSLHELFGHGVPAELFIKERPHYVTLNFAAADRALNENDLFSSRIWDEHFGIRAVGRTILNMVGEEHRHVRGAVQTMFTMLHANRWWKPKWIEGIVEELVSAFEKDGRTDLNQTLCAKLPMLTITRALGLDDSDAVSFRHDLVVSVMFTTPADERAKAAAAVRATLLKAMDVRRDAPREDILSGLMRAEIADEDGRRRKLTDDEVLNYCRILMIAGGGTTWRQLGITLMALLSEPENWERIKADRSLIEPAIRESLRWNCTDPLFFRLVERDTELCGVQLPAGAILEVCLGAANRDPSRWENPDRFDLDRPRQRHLGFAGGPHTCLGMFVAQAEMQVALNVLADRFPRLRLDPHATPPTMAGGLDARGVTHMQVRFD